MSDSVLLNDQSQCTIIIIKRHNVTLCKKIVRSELDENKKLHILWKIQQFKIIIISLQFCMLKTESFPIR